PFKESRVRKILGMVDIGDDLMEEQRREVQALIAEFADVFALSLKEVLPIDFIEHKLNVDELVKLPKRVHQRPLTEAQREWYMEVIDDMEAAGIISRIPPEEVKCAS
ncbi:hypothetical protein BOTBODRAFT_95376, partial [Botryobasidium botryosum FD-172 SS1]